MFKSTWVLTHTFDLFRPNMGAQGSESDENSVSLAPVFALEFISGVAGDFGADVGTPQVTPSAKVGARADRFRASARSRAGLLPPQENIFTDLPKSRPQSGPPDASQPKHSERLLFGMFCDMQVVQDASSFCLEACIRWTDVLAAPGSRKTCVRRCVRVGPCRPIHLDGALCERFWPSSRPRCRRVLVANSGVGVFRAGLAWSFLGGFGDRGRPLCALSWPPPRWTYSHNPEDYTCHTYGGVLWVCSEGGRSRGLLAGAEVRHAVELSLGKGGALRLALWADLRGRTSTLLIPGQIGSRPRH